MLTVVCVLKSGGVYDATWVLRLRDGVARHLPIEHRFVCLSDVDVPCERIPLVHGWPGWWSKLELYKVEGPVLYFDLDTAIVGDLTEIAAHARGWEMILLRDFYRPDEFASGVMGWEFRGPLARYEWFAEDPVKFMKLHQDRGDQGVLQRGWVSPSAVRCWQDELFGQIVSYKIHCRNGIPPEARVVCLHGKPKFTDMPANDPVRQAWEMAT